MLLCQEKLFLTSEFPGIARGTRKCPPGKPVKTCPVAPLPQSHSFWIFQGWAGGPGGEGPCSDLSKRGGSLLPQAVMKCQSHMVNSLRLLLPFRTSKQPAPLLRDKKGTSALRRQEERRERQIGYRGEGWAWWMMKTNNEIPPTRVKANGLAPSQRAPKLPYSKAVYHIMEYFTHWTCGRSSLCYLYHKNSYHLLLLL